jgi:YjbE family integral membrane protein
MNGFIDVPFADAAWTLAQVLLINAILSGDNAIIVGTAVVGLPPVQRLRALWLGIVAAMVLRLAFALVATQLLQILGLVLAGGILLLWVSWKLWREVAHTSAGDGETAGSHHGPTKTLRQALWQIVVADISMSLDNVLAVAGAASEHPTILIIGLAISVLLMGAAATAVAKVLERHRWLAHVGLVVIIYVALKMIWTGGAEIAAAMG